MKLHFDPDQEHQLAAIQSVVRLFDGQPRRDPDLSFDSEDGFAAVSNRLDLGENALVENLRTVQRDNELPEDESLSLIEESDDLAGGTGRIRFPNFTLEMETGTGKTYAYLRTALELHKEYGLRKFIVVVPYVAVREGVLKSLRMTREHFRALYDNVPYRFYAYDSQNLARVRNFALSHALEFMVMTLGSFNKAMSERGAGNVIYRPDDRLQGETPVDLIRAVRPVLILDEPQNMESEKSIRALSALDPMFALRYSATHRRSYNLVYRLTPYEAYRRGLVKRVEVAGVEDEDANRPYLRLKEIRAGKRSISAKLVVHRLTKGGGPRERTITVQEGDDLREKTRNPVYEGLLVSGIDARNQTVSFEDGSALGAGQERGPDKEVIFDAQIRYAVREHLRKQERLRPQGIKVLTLFFIDRVANYAEEDGLVRRLFDRAFDELKVEYEQFKKLDAAEVQAAYFASRTNRQGDTIFEDSKTGEAQRDEEAYDLIMRDKESLLSFPSPEDTPEERRKRRVAFIFSHSALREGWDSPNVFQICTLNESASEMRKRQEIGRGVRLAVNQDGQRVRDEDVNVLTVVANESYEHFVEQYQTELDADFGADGAPPKPPDARRSRTVRLRKKRLLAPEFRELWEKIRPKTRYEVHVDSGRVTSEVVAALEHIHIRPPRLVVSTVELEAEEDRFDYRILSRKAHSLPESRRPPTPNLVQRIADLLEDSSPPVRLRRESILDILRGLAPEKLAEALGNPQEFAMEAAQQIRRVLSSHLVDGIRYRQIGEHYAMSQFIEEFDRPRDQAVKAKHSLYDHVPIDSDVESEFAERLDRIDAVKLFVKLPRWFTVDTPVGAYNPDWAIVADRENSGGHDRLYLVRETKSSEYEDDRRGTENLKIACGERHFRGALGVDYQVVTAADDLVEELTDSG